jgi:hypothetical protein
MTHHVSWVNAYGRGRTRCGMPLEARLVVAPEDEVDCMACIARGGPSQVEAP